MNVFNNNNNSYLYGAFPSWSKRKYNTYFGNKWVFSFLLNKVRDSVFLNSSGSLFQIVDAQCVKHLSPNVFLDLGTWRRVESLAERRPRRFEWYGSIKSAMYEGARPLMDLKTWSRILKTIRLSIGSQWSLASKGDPWARRSWTNNTNFAALYWIPMSFLRSLFVMPYKRELQ